jgi:hypothetical protein
LTTLKALFTHGRIGKWLLHNDLHADLLVQSQVCYYYNMEQ